LHVDPPVHAVQLSPQWAESVAELHAPSEHSVLPAGHIEAHDPALHTPVDGHSAQLLPQCARSEATHVPLHKTSPDAHAHAPLSQVVPVLQATPHAPQFWLSVASTTHEVPHAISPAMHEGVTVEPVSEAPPSPPSPGTFAPEAQLTTTKIAEKTTGVKAKREKLRPSMPRLLTNGDELTQTRKTS